MPKRKPTTRKRTPRRTPDARALEWATAKLERAEKLHQWHTEKLQALHSEIPRLRGIIAALGPTPTLAERGAALGERTMARLEEANRRLGATPKIVAGMDVSRFVTPRAPVVAEPVAPDMNDEDAALEIVDGMLGAKPE